jgi:lipoprotein-anchoring transpeptidase ErfK/SrfK
MAASARFRHLGSIAFFASVMTIIAAPAFAQTLSYQPADRGLAFPQYAPQAQQPSAQSGDEMPAELRRQIVSYQGNEAAGTVIVDTAHTYLYLILGGGKAMRYGIGVGRQGFTWSGVQTITKKAEWPDWTPPPEMIARQPYLPRWVGGGPGNPLGARAMYLGGTDYRIHGTNDPTTIGKHVSSGCIRLANDDVIDLYSRINVGAKVIVLPNSDRNVAVEGGRRAAVEAPQATGARQAMQIQVQPANEKPLPPVPATAPMRVSILGVNFSGAN